MIGPRSRSALVGGLTLTACGRGAGALIEFAKLEPEEHESPPVIAARVNALLVDGRDVEARDLAKDMFEEFRIDRRRVGPVAELVHLELAAYYFSKHQPKLGRHFADTASRLESMRGPEPAEFADPLAWFLWDLIAEGWNQQSAARMGGLH